MKNEIKEGEVKDGVGRLDRERNVFLFYKDIKFWGL